MNRPYGHLEDLVSFIRNRIWSQISLILESEPRLQISTKSVVNPSMQLIRGSTYEILEDIKAKISNYSSVILLSNLAGKTGTAVGPLISNICKEEIPPEEEYEGQIYKCFHPL